MEEEFRFCENCKRNISAKNFVIHSAHCERNIKLCDRCSEPIPRSELKNHEEDFHSQEPCSDCGISVEKWQIEKHKGTCTKRLVPCEYCELEVPLDNLPEHIIVCGSRTEQCRKCKKHVMIKDLEKHPTKCFKKDIGVKKLLSCDYCKLELPIDYFSEHSAVCGSLTDQCPKCKKYVMRKDLEKHPINCLSKEPGAMACEYCDLQINLTDYEMHIAMCGTRTERCFLCNQHVMVLDRDTHLATCQKALNLTEEISCDYCEVSLSPNNIQRHVEICKLQTEKCNICNNYIQRSDMTLHLTMCKQKQQLRLNLPCEYCRGTFSHDCLEEHAALCGSQTRKCEKCDRYIELKNLKTHSNVCQEVQQLRLNYPCTYCGELFPRGCLEDHAVLCESRTQKCEKCDEYIELKKLKMHSTKCQQPKTHGDCPVCHQSVPWVEMNIHTTVCARMHYETDECERQNLFNEHALKKESEASTCKTSEEKEKQQTERCSFCFEIFPCSHFNQHLEVCSERPYNYENCLKPLPYRKKEEHMRYCRGLRTERHYANDYRQRDEEADDNKELKRHLEENTEICPSCKYKIPVERYNEHLHLCFEGRTQCHFCGLKISKNFEQIHFQNCPKILEMVWEDKNSQSKAKTGGKIEGKSLPKTMFENVTSWFSNKGKRFEKSNTLEALGEHSSSHLKRGQNYEKGNMTLVQQPSTVYNEVPCEFCNELWPFELLIEHQSGCRPDLVSFPKTNDGSEDQMSDATATAMTHTPVLAANPIKTREVDNEWKVQSRRNKPASNRENTDYPTKERSGPPKPQLSAKEKFFYYPTQDCDELLKKQSGSFNKKRYAQVRRSPEFSKKQYTEQRKSPEIAKKQFSQSRENAEISNTKYDKDVVASCEVKKADSMKNHFASYKFSMSECIEEMQNDSNSLKENDGASSTHAKIHDETKKSNSYAGIDSVKPIFNKGNKAVGAERTEKKRMTHSRGDIDADLGLVNKDLEEISLLKSITFDLNNKINEPTNIIETAESCTLNQDMPAIWNTEYKYDSRGKSNTLFNAVEIIGHSTLNSNIQDADYDEKNDETFGRDFVEFVKKNQNKEDENDAHSNSDDMFYDADDGGDKLVDIVNDNIHYSNDISEEKLSSYNFDSLNLDSRSRRENSNNNSYLALNVDIRLEEEELNNKDSDLKAYYQFLSKDIKQTDEEDIHKIAGNCKCGNKECCCATSSIMQNTSLPKACVFKDAASSKNCLKHMDMEPFDAETKTSTKLKSKKSSLKVSSKKKTEYENFANDEVLKWKKWRTTQASDSE